MGCSRPLTPGDGRDRTHPFWGLQSRPAEVDGGEVIVVLVVGWLLAGLVLALLVGGAVRIAEARGDWVLPTEPADAEATRVA